MDEVEFSSCSPAQFRSALSQRGVIILRGAIAKRKISAFKARLEVAMADVSKLTEDTIDQWNWQTWWPGNPKSFSLGHARHGSLNDAMVRDLTGETLSFYDLISAPAFHGLMAGGFPGLVFRSSIVAYCRLMEKEAKTGVKLHCDIRYQRDGAFALNFWTPLDPAGEKFGTSGLEIWPVGYAAMREYFQHDGISEGDFRNDLMEAIPRTFGPPLRTNVDTGDVMVFTSWTPHRTYIPENPRADRLSVEVRLATDQWPDPPRPSLKGLAARVRGRIASLYSQRR